MLCMSKQCVNKQTFGGNLSTEREAGKSLNHVVFSALAWRTRDWKSCHNLHVCLLPPGCLSPLLVRCWNIYEHLTESKLGCSSRDN